MVSSYRQVDLHWCVLVVAVATLIQMSADAPSSCPELPNTSYAAHTLSSCYAAKGATLPNALTVPELSPARAYWRECSAPELLGGTCTQIDCHRGLHAVAQSSLGGCAI